MRDLAIRLENRPGALGTWAGGSGAQASALRAAADLLSTGKALLIFYSRMRMLPEKLSKQRES